MSASLNAEQQQYVRETIAQLLSVDYAKVIPEARFFADLGGNADQLMTLRRRLETSLKIAIPPVEYEVNQRTEIDSNGLVPQRSISRISQLLGEWPGQPQGPVAFGDLFTVGMIEAMAAHAIKHSHSLQVPQTFSLMTFKGALIASVTQPPKKGNLLNQWSTADQSWWLKLPGHMGHEKFRLLMIGMQRAAYMRSGFMGAERKQVLDVAEKYAETGVSLEAMEKRASALSRWKTSSRFDAAVLSTVLTHDCHPQESVFAVEFVASRFQWDAGQTLAAIHQWVNCFFSPLPVDHTWNSTWMTPDVIALARQMHEMRIYSDFPKLGELLKAAGCDNAAILDHCCGLERRHMRGDWLIEAILLQAATLPSAKVTPTKKGKSTPQPKKPKFLKLGASDKRRLKEVVETQFGGISLDTSWSIAFQPGRPSDEAHWRKMVPTLTSSEIASLDYLYPALRAVLPEVVIARRIHLTSIEGMRAALAIYARVRLAIWHTHALMNDLEEDLLNGFIARDEIAIRTAIRELHYSPRLESDSQYWGYAALRAIALRDDALMRSVQDRWPYLPSSEEIPELSLGLNAILRNDPALLQRALEKILEVERDQILSFGVSLKAHGLYHVAQWKSPELASGLTAPTDFPWDVEYAAACAANTDPVAGLLFGEVPEVLRDYLQTGQIPACLRELLSERQKPEKALLGVVMTSVGPTPEKVLAAINAFKAQWTGDSPWSMELFAHRTSILPVTLYSYLDAGTRGVLRSRLMEAGASVSLE